MVFVSHEVPFPATSDRRSRVAGNGTEWEVKTIELSSSTSGGEQWAFLHFFILTAVKKTVPKWRKNHFIFFTPVHSADHAVWKGYFFGISMPSVIGLQMNKNQMPLTRGSLVLNLCKNSFFNPLAFIVLALWPSKLAKWQGPTRSMGYVLNCY